MWFDPRDFVETVRDGKKMVRLQPRSGDAGGGGAGGIVCALGVLKDASALGGASAGDVYITAGTINAAGTHTTVGGTGGTIFTPAIGDFIYAEVELTATEADSVLTGAWTAASAALVQASSVPADHAWEVGDNVGKAYASLGGWVDDGDSNPFWQGESCGDVTFVFCVQSDNTGEARYYRG